MPEWQALDMREPFLAIGLLGMCVSLGLAMSFRRLAPAVSMALVGGLAGATAGLVGWVFVPENLQQLDLLDGGIQASFGDGLPAAARGFTLGMVILGMVSSRLARAPTGFPRHCAGPLSVSWPGAWGWRGSFATCWMVSALGSRCGRAPSP